MRSPFYAPAELLSVIECQAFGLFSEIFGTGGALRYHDGVRANRTGCLARHPHDDHSSEGAFRHIETMELREEDVDDLFEDVGQVSLAARAVAIAVAVQFHEREPEGDP